MTIATEALPLLYQRLHDVIDQGVGVHLVFHLAFARAGMHAEAEAAYARVLPGDPSARYVAALARDPWTREPVPHAGLDSPLFAVGGIFARSGGERRRAFSLADLELRDAPTDRQAIWMQPALLTDFRDWQRHGQLHLHDAPPKLQYAFLAHIAQEPLHPDDACEALRYALRYAPAHVDALFDFVLEHPPRRAYEVVRGMRSDPRVFTLVERLRGGADTEACTRLLGMPPNYRDPAESEPTDAAILAAHEGAEAVLRLARSTQWQNALGAESLCYAVLLVGGHLD